MLDLKNRFSGIEFGSTRIYAVFTAEGIGLFADLTNTELVMIDENTKL